MEPPFIREAVRKRIQDARSSHRKRRQLNGAGFIGNTSSTITYLTANSDSSHIRVMKGRIDSGLQVIVRTSPIDLLTVAKAWHMGFCIHYDDGTLTSGSSFCQSGGSVGPLRNCFLNGNNLSIYFFLLSVY